MDTFISSLVVIGVLFIAYTIDKWDREDEKQKRGLKYLNDKSKKEERIQEIEEAIRRSRKDK